MSNKGYVYAYRSAWSHEAFKDLREAAIWNFIYQNAFWEDGERIFNGQIFHLKRGQIVVSLSFLAKGFGLSTKGMRTVMRKLEKLNMIDTQGTSRGTIITVVNYEQYQKKEGKGASKGQTKGKPRGKPRGNNKNEGMKVNEGNEDIYIPNWLDINTWNDFVEHRKGFKPALTELAIIRIMGKLKDLKEKGYDPNQLLDTAIESGWKTIYEPKGANNGTRTNNPHQNQFTGWSKANTGNLGD